MKLNRVKMFARRISLTDRLVRSPASFPSPWARRRVASDRLRPRGGVWVTGSASAGGLGHHGRRLLAGDGGDGLACGNGAVQ